MFFYQHKFFIFKKKCDMDEDMLKIGMVATSSYTALALLFLAIFMPLPLVYLVVIGLIAVLAIMAFFAYKSRNTLVCDLDTKTLVPRHKSKNYVVGANNRETEKICKLLSRR